MSYLDEEPRPFIKVLYGKRFPVSHVRFGQRRAIGKGGTPGDPTKLRDPYRVEKKEQFEDAFRADPTVRVAILRRVQFMLGRRTTTTLDVVEDYPSIQEILKQRVQTKETNLPPELDPTTNQVNKQDQQKIQDNQNKANPDNIATAAFPPKIQNSKDQMMQQQQTQQGGPPTAPMSPQKGNPNPLGNPALAAAPNDSMQLEINLLKEQLNQIDTKGKLKGSGDPNAPIDLEQLRRQALEVVMSNQEYINMKNQIDQVNRKVKFRHKIFAGSIQARVGGRAALFVEKYEDKLPADLKIMNWQRLGQVHIDDESWQLEGVEYLEKGKDDNMLDAEDLIYLTNLDLHISPNTIWYGLSDIETVADVSETNRLMDEEDIKEIAKGLWAGYGLLKFESKNASEISTFLKDFSPGTWTATNLPVDAQIMQLTHNLKELVDAREQGDRRILRGLQVPNMIVGFEDVQNRATGNSVLAAWKASVLEDDRTWLRDLVEPQWFDSMTSIILNEPNIDDIKVKVKMSFEDITFDTLPDLVPVLVQLFSLGIIPADKILSMCGFEDVIEEMKLKQVADMKARLNALLTSQQQQQERFQQQQQLMQQQHALTQNQGQQPQQLNQKTQPQPGIPLSKQPTNNQQKAVAAAGNIQSLNDVNSEWLTPADKRAAVEYYKEKTDFIKELKTKIVDQEGD